MRKILNKYDIFVLQLKAKMKMVRIGANIWANSIRIIIRCPVMCTL